MRQAMMQPPFVHFGTYIQKQLVPLGTGMTRIKSQTLASSCGVILANSAHAAGQVANVSIACCCGAHSKDDVSFLHSGASLD